MLKRSISKLSVLVLAVSAALFTACSSSGVKAENDSQAKEFLEDLGWSCSECTEILNIVIPAEFSDVYRNYNELQKQEGYDLSRYAGDEAVRYTYNITNYPAADGGFESDIKANVITVRGVVVGGDISSAELDGFMRPLIKRGEG